MTPRTRSSKNSDAEYIQDNASEDIEEIETNINHDQDQN